MCAYNHIILVRLHNSLCIPSGGWGGEGQRILRIDFQFIRKEPVGVGKIFDNRKGGCLRTFYIFFWKTLQGSFPHILFFWAGHVNHFGEYQLCIQIIPNCQSFNTRMSFKLPVLLICHQNTCTRNNSM